MKKHLFLSVLALSLGLPITGSVAQQTSSEQMLRDLVPKPKTRSLNGPTRGIKVEGRRTENASLNLYINFEYNSSELKQDSLIVLDQLAAAINNDRLVKYDFLIAGHTDAKGSDAYNLALSQRRARSVKNYLIARHPIQSSRLIEKGFGESRLLDGDNPLDGSNRRVQIVTLSLPAQ